MNTQETREKQLKPCRPDLRIYNVFTHRSVTTRRRAMAGGIKYAFNKQVRKHYRKDFGRPAKEIRLMVSLLLLKHIRSISDESVGEKWNEDAYYQYFSGKKSFTAEAAMNFKRMMNKWKYFMPYFWKWLKNQWYPDFIY